MKNAIILDGGYSNPKHYWYPSIKRFLKKRGYSVWTPQLPGAEPDLKNWLPFILKGDNFNQDTVLIAHSLGAALVLAILEKINVKIKKTILIAGFSTPRGNFKEKMLLTKYNWRIIKSHTNEFIIMNSKNDPWGCDDKQGINIWKHLGGTLILLEKEGHFGSEKNHQSYKRFNLLEKLLEE